MEFLNQTSGMFFGDHFTYYVIGTVLATAICGFFGLPLFCYSAVALAALVGFGAPTTLTLATAAVLLVFNIPILRQTIISTALMNLVRKLKILPTISETERTRVAAESLQIRHDFFDLECLGYGSKIFLADSLENRLGNRVNMHPPLVNKLARAALLHNSENKLIRGAFHWTADHVPFANIGAATAQICTGETTSGHDNLGSTRLDHIAHTSRDVRENIDIDNLASVTDILYTMLQRYEELG